MKRFLPLFALVAVALAACGDDPRAPTDLTETPAFAITVTPSATGATVDTDKEDYYPGETVLILGAGWAPGETVNLHLAESPVADGDHEWDVVADADGRFTDTSFSPGEQHLGVRFTLTATGPVSGTSVAVFTDGNKVSFSTTSTGAEVTNFGSVATNVCVDGYVQERQGSNIDNGTHAARAVLLGSSPSGVLFYSGLGCTGSPVSSVTIPANAPSAAFSFKSASANTYALSGDGGLTGNNNADATVTVTAPANVNTTTTASGATATYGDASVGLTAMVSPNANGGTVLFTVKKGATTIGTTSGTVSGGAAAASFSLTGVAADTYTIEAAYSGAAGFNAGNNAAQPPPNLTVAKKDITGSFTASDKQYDGNTTATVLTRSLTGVVGADAVTLSGGTATFADAAVGTGKTVTLTGATLAGGAAGNYNLLSVATTTASITALSVTGSFTAQNKVYDGTTAATVLTRSVSGAAPGDDVTLTGGTATFDTRNVGTNKTVTLAGATLSGADAANYSLSMVSTALADITPRGLTVTATGVNKVYDGTTSATVTLSTDKLGSDAVTAAFTSASFVDRNVGTGKTVNVSGISISGGDAGNYSLLNTTATTTADIAKLGITGSFTAGNKVYDGNTTASVLTRTLSGAIVGDDVQLTNGNATFADKNVGTGKIVTLAGATLGGADAGNYQLNSVATTTANITPRDLTVSATGVNKVYDGNTTATVTLSTDKLGADVVTSAYASASFVDKNVGTGKMVNVSGISIGGADAGNYDLLNPTATATADITRKPITGVFTAADKVFDDTKAATVLTRSLNAGDVVSPDEVNLTGGTAEFASKAVGTWPVTLTGATLSGADAGNYTLSSVANASASILAWNAQGYGFFQPVGIASTIFVAAPGAPPSPNGTTIWNTAKGGSTIPLKFRVFAGSVEKTNTSDIRQFTAVKLACTVGVGGEEPLEFVTTGNTMLRYDATDQQFIQNWKTPSAGSEACYRATVEFLDGSTLSAFFRLKK